MDPDVDRPAPLHKPLPLEQVREYLAYAPHEEPTAVAEAMDWIADVHRLALFCDSSDFFLREAMALIRNALTPADPLSCRVLLFSLARRQWARFARGHHPHYDQRLLALLAEPEFARLCTPPPQSSNASP